MQQTEKRKWAFDLGKGERERPTRRDASLAANVQIVHPLGYKTSNLQVASSSTRGPTSANKELLKKVSNAFLL